MGRFRETVLGVEYDESRVVTVSGDELAIRNLGLPRKLAESLELRGIRSAAEGEKENHICIVTSTSSSSGCALDDFIVL